MNHARIQQIIESYKLPAYRIRQIRQAIFKEHITSFRDITTLSRDLRERLASTEPILSFEPAAVQWSADRKAAKVLLRMGDGENIESVLMTPKPGLWSTCISTQAGCALGCRFCATGQQGFRRDLSAEEITDQVLFWQQFMTREMPAEHLQNVVYMGMGEPFRNCNAVFNSLEELLHPDTFNLGARHLSISTVGIISGIQEFTRRFPQVNLAISLHAADDDLRQRLIPSAGKQSLDQLARVIDAHIRATNRKVFIEYILLSQVNDSNEQAGQLIRYLRSIGNWNLLHVNLIVYNEISGPFTPSATGRVHAFREYLQSGGIHVTIRKSLGGDIAAACGQLAQRQK